MSYPKPLKYLSGLARGFVGNRKTLRSAIMPIRGRLQDLVQKLARKHETIAFLLEDGSDLPRLMRSDRSLRLYRGRISAGKLELLQRDIQAGFPWPREANGQTAEDYPRSENRRKAASLFSDANELLRRRKIERAFDLLRESLAHDPNPVLGLALFELLAFYGSDDYAFKLLSNIGRRWLPAQVRLGELLEKRGMIDEAVRALCEVRDQLTNRQYSFMLQTMLKSPTATSAQLLEAQAEWATRFCEDRGKDIAALNSSRFRRKPWKIAYHCTFWNSETIRHQLLPIIAHHDRTKFSVHAYSPVPLDQYFMPYLDVVRIVDKLADVDFARLVREDEIVVFVECTGFSAGHRYSAMALRCAPVQISYLNHTGTSGTPNVDYVLADRIALRADEEQFYTERVYRLPGSFFCFNFEDSRYPVPGAPPVLRNGFVTFGCFGSNGKMNPTLLAWWAEIMTKVPSARLYVRNFELSAPENRRHFRQQMIKHGISQERLVLRGGVSHDQLIRCYEDVDISLDTWPYSGGNTIAESLWQGVPVVTYRGQRFSSAYGASLLESSGCAELIAESPEQYILCAVELAHDPQRIAFYRRALRDLTRQGGFNDARKFAFRLEEAFEAMVNGL